MESDLFDEMAGGRVSGRRVERETDAVPVAWSDGRRPPAPRRKEIPRECVNKHATSEQSNPSLSRTSAIHFGCQARRPPSRSSVSTSSGRGVVRRAAPPCAPAPNAPNARFARSTKRVDRLVEREREGDCSRLVTRGVVASGGADGDAHRTVGGDEATGRGRGCCGGDKNRQTLADEKNK